MLHIVEDGLSLNLISGTGTIKCIADDRDDVPEKYTTFADIFPELSIPGDYGSVSAEDLWYVMDVQYEDGVFIDVQLNMTTNAGRGLDVNGKRIDVYSEAFGKYDPEPREIMSVWGNGLIRWLSWDRYFDDVPSWMSNQKNPVPGPFITWTVTFESGGQTWEGLADSIDNLPFGVSCKVEGSLYCVDVQVTQDAEQKERGAWTNKISYYIAPPGVKWKKGWGQS